MVDGEPRGGRRKDQVTSKQLLTRLKQLRDGAASADGLTTDVTGATSALLFPSGTPDRLVVHAHRDSNPAGSGVYPYLYFKEQPETGLPKQIMRIDPETGEIHIDDPVKAVMMLGGQQLDPAIAGLADRLESLRPQVAQQIEAENVRQQALAEQRQKAEQEALERIKGYPMLDRLRETSGLSASFLLEKLAEHGVWDIGRNIDTAREAGVRELFEENATDIHGDRAFAIVHDKPLSRVKGAAFVTTGTADEFLGGVLADDILGEDSAFDRLNDARIHGHGHNLHGHLDTINSFLRMHTGNHGDRKVYVSADTTDAQIGAIRTAAQDSFHEWRREGRVIVERLPATGKILPISYQNNGYHLSGIFLGDKAAK